MTSKGQRYLGIIFFLTLAFCVFEFIGGKLSGSLALLADAGHMLADLSALGLAYFASRMAARPSTPRMSYGFHRIEVLSALINGAILVAVAILIAKEAFQRLNENSEIHTGMMLWVAFAGLVFNIAAGFLLKSVAHESVNLLGAFFHVMSDALSSVGTIVAGCVIALTGWRYADPLVSFMIACLIGVSAWRLLRDVVTVLLEATPLHIDIEVLEKKVLALSGVRGIHDLHVWSISTGKESLSVHVEVADGVNRDSVLSEIHELLSREFGIDHATLQVETEAQRKKEKNHFHS